ncbi:MAG: chromosomal replication initiator protein DnaA [Akkermansiaceae bacterium]|jgi:chromosomal replication initiator protein|nr:chromosomal replication initiator protein DnaA [Akkermansiaceae bacterium]
MRPDQPVNHHDPDTPRQPSISSADDGSATWHRICDGLRTTVGADSFHRWFDLATWVSHEDGVAAIAVPGEIHQVWIEANYLPELLTAVSAVCGDTREVKLVLDSSLVRPRGEAPAAGGRTTRSTPVALEGEALEKRVKAAGLNPFHSFESFVVGSNSQFAHAACQAVAHNHKTGYNPLFIHGGSGLGKTHLMHAIGQELLRRRPSCRIVYLTCEKFTNEFIDAVRGGDLEKFRRRYRQSDILLIDDIQFLTGKERSQEEFFHTFNTLLDSRSQVILASDRPASEIRDLEPRLVSRFECGLTVEIQPPQIETRLAILKSKSAAWKVRLDESVINYLAENIRTNVRRLEGALMRVASFASLGGESVTVEKVEPLLRDLLIEEASRPISIDAIQKTVAEQYDVRLADMVGRRRPKSIAFPRQVAMFLSRNLTQGSLMEIGEAFGGRDHGTVIHACKTIQRRLEQDPGLKDALARIESLLRR